MHHTGGSCRQPTPSQQCSCRQQSAGSCRQQNASQAVVVWQGRRKDGHSSQVKLPVPSAPQLSLKNDHLHLQRQIMVNDHWSFLSSCLYQHWPSSLSKTDILLLSSFAFNINMKSPILAASELPVTTMTLIAGGWSLLEEGHWPFGFLSDYHQREEKPRENQWSSVLPYGASSSTTKQNQGGFRFAEGLVVTVSSLKVPTDNLLEKKTWGAIMKRQPGWIVLKMGRSLVSLGNFDLTSLWFKRSVIIIKWQYQVHHVCQSIFCQ